VVKVVEDAAGAAAAAAADPICWQDAAAAAAVALPQAHSTARKGSVSKTRKEMTSPYHTKHTALSRVAVMVMT